MLNEEHVAIVVATSMRENERSGRFDAGEEVLFSFSFENVLAPGRYNPLFTLAHRGTGLDLMDRFEGAFSFVVTGPEAMGGLIDLPVEVGVTRSAETVAATARMSSEAVRTRAPGGRSRGRGRSPTTGRASGISRTTSRATSSSCASSARCSATSGS